MKRMSTLASPTADPLSKLQKYKDESEKEVVDEHERVYHHGSDEGGQEVPSVEISKLSVNDKSKGN